MVPIMGHCRQHLDLVNYVDVFTPTECIRCGTKHDYAFENEHLFQHKKDMVAYNSSDLVVLNDEDADDYDGSAYMSTLSYSNKTGTTYCELEPYKSSYMKRDEVDVDYFNTVVLKSVLYFLTIIMMRFSSRCFMMTIL